MTVLRRVSAIALLMTVVAGCGGEGPVQETAAPTTSGGPAQASEPVTGPASEAPRGAAPASDICALLDDAEIREVLGESHRVSVAATFGSLTDVTGGQCVWTDDPSGDAFAAGATQLELVVFVPDGPNPLPGDAPAIGVQETVESVDGTWIGAVDRVLWLRATGSRTQEPGLATQVAGLAAAVRSRL